MLDPGQVLGGRGHREGVQGGGIHLGVRPQPRGLRPGARRADLARRLGLGLCEADLPYGLGLGPYRVGGCVLLGLAARVGAALLDEPFLLPG